jgi:hypothetical protein
MPAKPFDICRFVYETTRAKRRVEDHVRRVTAILSDSGHEERREHQECKSCFYIDGRLGGSAITHTQCGLCGKELVFSSTCVDAVCPECAAKHSLCRHCGGDLNMRVGRRKWPTPTQAPLQPT